MRKQEVSQMFSVLDSRTGTDSSFVLYKMTKKSIMIDTCDVVHMVVNEVCVRTESDFMFRYVKDYMGFEVL